MILPVYIWPSPSLWNPAIPFESREFQGEAGANLHKLLDLMAETMKSMQGLGLAMPQIGQSRRGLVVLLDYETSAPRIVEMLNPQILDQSDLKLFPNEGCLSFPGIRVDTKRYTKLTVSYLDRHGVEHTETFSGSNDTEVLNAVAIQHEIGHLDGKLLVDFAGPTRRQQIRAKLTKLQRELTRQGKAQLEAQEMEFRMQEAISATKSSPTNT